ncbi:hypothetical protein MAR_028859 [Mya arenaria]|uniref:B box-type domain-containing protein n=1 Tax=Mya arenaria TaxID=6604 RepID=A0ABY7DI64_MYAAR|nr:hypothetical protein MAR_028859 [Mya arenaria]
MEVSGKLLPVDKSESTTDPANCQPCSKDGKHVPAISYCQVCAEFLCPSCAKTHRNMSATASHALRENGDMPNPASALLEGGLTEPCKEHPGEFIKYHCPAHKKLCCGHCIVQQHQGCKMNIIAEVSRDFLEGRDYNTLKANLSDLKEELGQCSRDIEAIQESTTEDCLKDLDQLRAYTTDIKQHLDQREQELSAQIYQIKEEKQSTLNSLATNCQSLQSKCQKTTTQLETQESNSNKLFIAANRALEQTPGLQREVEELKHKMNIPQYKLTKDANTKERFSKLDSKNIRLIRKHFFSSDFITDVTDMTLLPDDRLLFVDRNNKNVKLMLLKQDDCSSVELNNDPFGLCVLPGDRAAVTLPIPGKICLIKTLGNLSKEDSFEAGKGCRGIAYHDGKLIVSFQKKFSSPARVVLMDLKGNVLKSSEDHSNRLSVFQQPFNLTANSKHSLLYISDCGTNMVTELNIDLAVVQTFPLKTKPSGITSIGDTELLVCSRSTNAVSHIDTSTGQITEILEGKDGADGQRAVQFCLETHLLYKTEYTDSKCSLGVYKDDKCVFAL